MPSGTVSIILQEISIIYNALHYNSGEYEWCHVYLKGFIDKPLIKVAYVSVLKFEKNISKNNVFNIGKVNRIEFTGI